MGTFNVYVRDLGDGCWRAMTLPVTIQAAVTLAGAARKLDIADEVRLSRPPSMGQGVDVRV